MLHEYLRNVSQNNGAILVVFTGNNVWVYFTFRDMPLAMRYGNSYIDRLNCLGNYTSCTKGNNLTQINLARLAFVTNVSLLSKDRVNIKKTF